MRLLLAGLREFRARPGVSSVAVVTLALGVAGATTMFAMLGAIGGAMVPAGVDPALVGRVVWTSLDESGLREPLSARECTALVGATSAFESFAFWSDESVVVGDDGPAVSAKRVSPGFFRTLRFSLAAGREFSTDEYREGTPRAAIASAAFIRRFPTYALGKAVRLNGSDVIIVGVLAAHHWYPAPGTDIWLPLPVSRDGSPLVEPVSVTVRLRGADGLEQARSQVAVVTRRVADAAMGRPRKLSLITLKQDVDKRAGFGLVGLLGPSIVVLLIACGNVANLLLARATGRDSEMAVRAALGAGRWRLVRERLAEGAWLAAAGGAIGLGLAVGGVAALRAWVASAPESREAADMIRLHGGAVLFAVAVTALIPFVFGLVPALVASRPNLRAALHRVPGRRKPRRGPYGGRDLLVVVEVGLAVVLVVSAGMFARFFAELGRVRWGFDPTKVVVVELSLKRSADVAAANATLVGGVLAAARAVPGVESAASGAFGGLDPIWRGEAIEFESCALPSSALGAVATPVDADFFQTLGISLRRGRAIAAGDTSGSPRVAVISQRHADKCWPGQDPLGRRLRSRRGAGAGWMTVVGVAPDAMTTSAIQVVQPVYVPVSQVNGTPGTIFLRTRGDAASLVGALRAAVRGVDKAQPGDGIGRLDERTLASLSGTPVILGILGGFGLFALALAALGVFSVISYMVAERTREFGIRMALGASRSDVLRLVVAQAAAIIAIGAAVSIAGTLAVTRITFREMADLAVTDFVLWLGVTTVLALVAFAATVVPARRATRVEPMVALRAE